MKRVAVVFGLCTLLLPIAAWADTVNLINQFGSVSLTSAGIVSRGAELMSFNGVQAPPKHSLGSVSFSTGALISGSVLGGGFFSSMGSSLLVIGAGKYGQPKGTIFSAVSPVRSIGCWSATPSTIMFFISRLTAGNALHWPGGEGSHSADDLCESESMGP